ncbi:InlB B-repeat-containing protein [Thermophilibacter sp.]
MSSSAALNILSGGVPSITGAGTIPIGANIVIGFGSRADIAARIPSGLEIDEQDGKFYIKAKVTEETADVSVKHSDGSPVAYYQMDSTDTFDLRDGDTLTLLKSVNRQIDVKANGDVTIDLGGCSVTSSTDYALSVKQIAHNGNVTVKSSAPAKLSGTKAGISIDGLDMAAATLDYQSSNITLAPACIELGNARIPFNEANARLVTNGGFRTVVDGMPYIYGELSAAANEADANTEITLLNDYNGTEPMLVSSQGTVVVDLGGHTYTTSATCAAQIGMANVNATFKNGAIVSTSTNESANIVGVYLGSGGLANVNLTLDNVNLSMGHSGNAGVIVQGLNINNTVTLDGCKLTVPDDVMGIYFPPADSSLVINDTVINAGTGIGIKGGSLTVSGSSEIHAHGTNDQSDIPATGGIAETGAAIYVDDGYAANDNRNVTVTIKDGTFSSDKGSAIQELVSKPGSNPPVQIAVSGGSFDDTSIAGYLVPDAAVAVGADGSCTVYPSVEEARANGGGYQVVDKDGNTWFFSTPEAAAEFAKGQDDSAEVKEVLWTVTFDDCLDSTENQTVSVRNGEPVARPAEDPVCAGYRFLGWYSDKALTQAWDFGTPVHGDLTLYAKWEQVGGSTTTEKPAKPGSDTTTVDGGLAKTSDPTLVAPLAASALAGASVLGVALGLRRRDR